ncbi:MAG TPA: cyclodeaminase/cyclohydrolase family protein [Candidatus Thalassarchaeaceae archaeon]|nr:cyclodeaminase/cyclohydrolase family protein [Candidatus Thalassarchaeaceae archaeon]|tara:strand:+ start:764 stop:1384 length:621 start_codon:yes stop_codon:yes gene_type:complete
MNEGYNEILRSIGSSEPTPGGGSVAALSLAHAHSLATMVARLTLGKEKWSEGHEVAQSVISESQVGVEEAIRLAEFDAEAFDAVMTAYRLPRETENQKEARSVSIRNATIGAAEAPLATASSACKLLSNLEKLCVSCNSNALTDLASASELSLSAVKMAAMNVRINLEYIKGDDVDLISSQIDQVVLKSTTSAESVRLKVNERLSW